MSTKPTTLPRWADSGGAVVEPTSGKKDVGFVDEERPPAEYLNWLLTNTYLWTQYLDDAAFSGGASVAGGLTVAGTRTGSHASDTGTGLTTQDLNVTGWFNFDGKILTTNRSYAIPAFTGYVFSGTAGTWNGDRYTASGGAVTLHFPILIPYLSIFDGVHVWIKDTGSAVIVKLYTPDGATAPFQTNKTQVGTTLTSSAGTADQLLSTSPALALAFDPYGFDGNQAPGYVWLEVALPNGATLYNIEVLARLPTPTEYDSI